MSEVVRLTLVSHAMTDAMAAGRFPVDESLTPLGRSQLDRLNLGAAEHLLSGPEARVRETAEALGLRVRIDERLADLDCGQWRGRALGELDPVHLARWMSAPGDAPHGGESIVALTARVRGWLGDVGATQGRTLAVTHPAVVRAAILTALEAPPKSFWRIDVAPASRTVLHFRGSAWTLRSGFDQR
ncbi:histidine phosphatase family protein [Mycolicibacterium litorale]|nr:histidine phosphatase family protein [Mycolicibacterium litorale]